MRDGESLWRRLGPSGGPAEKESRRSRAFLPGGAAAGLEGRQLMSLTVGTFAAPAVIGTTQDLTKAPNGNVWFTEPGAGKIGVMVPTGQFLEVSIPSGHSALGPIAAGPDGNVWFTETNAVARVSPIGVVTEFPVAPNARLTGITAGPDGNVWFMDSGNQQVGKITPTGAVTEFPIPNAPGLKSLSENNAYHNITAGPDGNVWFTTEAGNSKTRFVTGEIGRITPAGDVTLTRIPSTRASQHGKLFGKSSNNGTLADAITAGPDGNVWFTEHQQNGVAGIGKITPAGRISQFVIPTTPKGAKASDYSLSITTGPDHNLWFNLTPPTTSNDTTPAPFIGRATPAGKVNVYAIPNAKDTQGALLAEGAESIIAGPDGKLWFTASTQQYLSQTGRVIGTVTPP